MNVIFTGVSATLASLRAASALARSLNARIRLVVPAIVPFPLPLGRPPVARWHAKRRFIRIARAADVEMRVEICYGRDLDTILGSVLPLPSLVVVGGKRRWWPTAAGRAARILGRSGHHVVFVEQGAKRG